ncbi:MAG: putative drug exporter of the superfamily [Actinomycetota bacterium]|nr:putative drug exporter of the superfamily [Actinomycetota bacterium]
MFEVRYLAYTVPRMNLDSGTAVETPEAPHLTETAESGRRTVASWCVLHRWRTLLAAVLVLAGALVLLGGGLRTTTDVDRLAGDSATAAKLSAGVDFGVRPTENVVVTSRSGSLDAATAARLGAELTAAYNGVKGVAKVGQAVLAPDGRTLVLAVGLDTVQRKSGVTSPPTISAEALAPMLAETARMAGTHPSLRIGQVGPASFAAEKVARTQKDLQRAEYTSLPVTLGVLLIAFGAVVAAGVPLLLGLGAVVVAFGLTALTSRTVTPVDESTQSLVLLIGLAVGVDYALFIVRRSREERAAGATNSEAIVRAGATAGRAVLISGITVIIAMSGMLVAGGMFTSLAVGTMIVVAVAVVGSATVLPALLAVLGDKVDAVRLPFTRRRDARRGSRDGGWGRLAGAVTRRPLVWAVVAAGLLVTLALPALGMQTTLAGPESLPKDYATIEAYDRLTAAFPQEGSTIDVLVKAPAAASGSVDDALARGLRAAQASGLVAGGSAKTKVSTDGTVHVLAVPVPGEVSDPRFGRAVDSIRAGTVPVVRAALADVPGAQVHLGGNAAYTDLTRWMDQRLVWVVSFVLLLTLVVMLVSFGSPWLAVSTVALNLLSVGAAYGVITLIFQHTWAQGLLGFTSLGAIESWVPLLMFVVLFGLSMDYHIFVVSRVREAWNAGCEPREAVRMGVARSAGVVTSAAAVMVAVFAIFGTLSSIEMKEMGVGLASAILLDATLVRGLLLPAVLAMLGRRAHTGPAWLPVLHP